MPSKNKQTRISSRLRQKKFAETTQGTRRFRQHDDDSISENATLSEATDLRNEGRKADVETAILNVHMKDGDVVHAKPPPEWQPETLDPSKGTVIGKLQKSLCGLRSAPRRWQDHAASSRTCWTLACGHTTKRVSLVFHVDDLLLAGTHQMIKKSTLLSRSSRATR